MLPWGSPGPAPPEGPWHPLTFLRSKNKKEKQKKKRKNWKAETIKRLSPRSKCYCFSHSRVSRIQKCFLSTNHDGKFLNFRRFRMAKTVTFWPWWQPFNNFCFQIFFSFVSLFSNTFQCFMAPPLWNPFRRSCSL